MSAKSTGKTIKTVSTKKKGIQVEFEDGEKLLLSEDVFTEFHLYDGKELSESELRKLKELAGQDVYYAYALKLLSKDMYSCHQVKEKVLAKGAEPELASKIVSRLRKAGLLDDERFARTFASDVGDLRLYGRNKIVYELKVKGVPYSIITDLSFPEEEELDKAKRYGKMVDARSGKTPYEQKKFKIVKALLNRGYDLRIAEEAAESSATKIDPKDEEMALSRQFDLARSKYSRKYFGYELKEHIRAYLIRRGFAFERIQEKLQEIDNEDQ